MSVHDERGEPWYFSESTITVDIPCFDDIRLTFSRRTELFLEYKDQLDACLQGRWVRSGITLIVETEEDAVLAKLILG